MRCPYTATKNFFKNAVDAFQPHVDKEPVTDLSADLPAPFTDEEALTAFMEVNKTANGVTHYSASTVRGNRRATVFIGAQDATVWELIPAEMHGVLRWIVGEVGGKLDKTSLPPETQIADQALDDCVKQYRGETLKLRRLYEDRHGGPVAVTDKLQSGGEYYGLPDLYELLDNEKLDPKAKAVYDSGKQQIARYEETAEELLKTIDGSWKGTKTFRLKGDDTDIPNKSSAVIQNPAKWFFYAKHGAVAIFDTMKIPDQLSTNVDSTLNATDKIIPTLIAHLQELPQMQTPSIMGAFHRGLEKLQNAVVQCDPWENLNRDFGPMLKMLHIDSEENYRAVKQRAAQSGGRLKANKDEITNDGKKFGCPYVKPQESAEPT